VPVSVRQREGQWEVSLTSVLPRHEPAAPALVAGILEALEWAASDLDPAIPPARIYAGNWHVALAARTAARLADLDYDFDLLKAVMQDAGLATLQLVWRERHDLYHSRNPFPVGGVVEDPASGSAAAAFAGYLRDARLIDTPASIVILQGETMGRPSRLEVAIPAAGGIVVSGHAVPMTED
jgi:PhzF family phenazine biosynthesis protein